jgi:hypothetical protein
VSRWLLSYLPNFTKLNLFDRFTDGIAAVSGPDFVGLMAYALILAFAALSFAVFLFGRRQLT